MPQSDYTMMEEIVVVAEVNSVTSSSAKQPRRRLSMDEDDDDNNDDQHTHLSSESLDILRTSHDGSEQFKPDEESANMKKEKQRKMEHKAIRELTINKLNYQAIGLVGREKEVDTLRSCLYRAATQSHHHRTTTPSSASASEDNVLNKKNTNTKKELVLITGYSGIGKSKIARTAHGYVNEISSSNHGIVVHGKFDQNAYEEPYSGISAVFGELCETILDGIENDQDQGLITIRENILVELMSEIELLQRLIPSLSELASLEDYTVSNSTTGGGGGGEKEETHHGFEAEFERLKYAFRVLTRLLCSHFSPLVLILDDLQWADTASLQTIDFLLSDTENSKGGLVIIGLYRSNELQVVSSSSDGDDGAGGEESQQHPLTQTLNILESKGEALGINITRIEVKSLDTNGINRIIMAMLGIDDSNVTKGLAEICYRRTLGNPFFVIEFITMLEMEGMISYNLGLLKWTWNETLIEEKTMSTSNVVDLLQARMKRLPDHLQVLLQYAACLGAEFKISALETILQQSTFVVDANSVKNQDSNQTIRKMLQQLERGNFIEAIGTTSYRWMHDKIQEAALTFGLALKPSFQYDVGWILYCNLSGYEFEEMLFDITNLINKGKHQQQRPDFAKLNLRAAEKARRASAFHSAAAYASVGIQLLPTDTKWTDHSNLTLKLYSLGAEMEVALGNSPKVESYVNEVLSQSHLSMLEKLPVYEAKSLKLTNIDLQHEEALRFLCQALTDFGYWVPLGMLQPFHALRVLRRTVQAAKKRPIRTFENPKLMTNPSDKAAMLFLSRIFYTSYFTGSKFLLVFAACQMVQLTLDRGVSTLSGQGYASLGMITTAVMGDFAMSAFLAETGLAIQDAIQSKYMESQTIFLSSSYILSWCKPLASQLDLLRRGYSVGLRAGNVEFGFWCQHGAAYIYPYLMGKPLQSINFECAKCIPQMEELKQNEQMWATRSAWQLVLNLMGEAENDLVLHGRALKHGQGESKAIKVVQQYQTSELYLFFGHYKLAAESALERGEEFNEVLNGSALVMIETFHRAIALFAMARKTKKSKYSKPAHRIRKKIAGWVKSGNPNVKHYEYFLQAEHAALRGKTTEAKDQYEEAIKMAARTGHLHHAALFNERFADFLQHDLSDEEESFYRWKEAIRWYEEWGAKPKVEILTDALKRNESRSAHMKAQNQ